MLKLPSFIRKLNENPVFVKDRYVEERPVKRRDAVVFFRMFIRFLGIGFIIILFLCNQSNLLSFISSLITGIGTYCFVVVFLRSKDSFTKEKRQKTFDQLTSTMMTPKEIVLGKLWYAIEKPLSIVTMLFIPLLLVSTVISNVFPGLFCSYIFILSIMMLSSFLGLYISAIAENTYQRKRLVLFGFIIVLIVTFISSIPVKLVFSKISFEPEDIISDSCRYRVKYSVVVETFPWLNPNYQDFYEYSVNPISNMFFLKQYIKPGGFKDDYYFKLQFYTAYCVTLYLLAAWILFRKTVEKVSQLE